MGWPLRFARITDAVPKSKLAAKAQPTGRRNLFHQMPEIAENVE